MSRCAHTYVCDFALDVLQQVFLSSDEERMLELRVVFVRLHQTALLDVNHLPEAILEHVQKRRSTIRNTLDFKVTSCLLNAGLQFSVDPVAK